MRRTSTKPKLKLKKNEEKDDFVDMTGTWLVTFGYGVLLEGCKLLTLRGYFSKDTLVDELVEFIEGDLTDDVKSMYKKIGQSLVLRNMSKLG